MNGLRVILYTRVSTDEQADEGTGLETQEIECTRYAERLGMQIVGIESDPGISGTVLRRPGIMRAIEALEAGRAEALIVYNASRLGRKTLVTLTLWESIQAGGARLFLTDTGEVTEDNEFMLTIQGGFAQHEHKEIVKRMSAGRRRLAENHKMPARVTSPFGYHIVQKIENGSETGERAGTYEVMEEQAVYAREIFARYASGDSLRSICAWLTREGVPLPGKRRAGVVRAWHPTTIKRILSNTVYKGVAVWGKTVVKKSGGKKNHIKTTTDKQVAIPVPALVSPEEWDRCQEFLKSNKGAGARIDRKHLFASIARCAYCGVCMKSGRRRMKRTTSRGEREYVYVRYMCPRSNNAINVRACESGMADHNEDRMRAHLRAVLTRIAGEPEFMAAAMEYYRRQRMQGYSEAEHAEVITALRELGRREEAAAQAFIEAKMLGAPEDTFKSILTKIASERKALEARKAKIEATLTEVAEEDEKDITEIAQEMAQKLLQVLDSEAIATVDKNANLRRYVQSMFVKHDETRFVFYPFSAKGAIPVATVKNGSVG